MKNVIAIVAKNTNPVINQTIKKEAKLQFEK